MQVLMRKIPTVYIHSETASMNVTLLKYLNGRLNLHLNFHLLEIRMIHAFQNNLNVFPTFSCKFIRKKNTQKGRCVWKLSLMILLQEYADKTNGEIDKPYLVLSMIHLYPTVRCLYMKTDSTSTGFHLFNDTELCKQIAQYNDKMDIKLTEIEEIS